MKKRQRSVAVAVTVSVLWSVSVSADDTHPTEPGALAEQAVPAEGAKPAEETLDAQLQALSLPENQSPVPISGEKLYSVQTRYSPLKGRHEFSLGFGKNMTPASYLSSNQVDLTYRYHLGDRWSVGLGGSYVFNSLSDAGQKLQELQGMVPDQAFTKYRASLALNYNLFYGKFRLSMDRVFYFDQYIALGPAYVVQDRGSSAGAFGDIGLALWFGKKGSLRMGLKDYFFHETRRLSEGSAHDLIFHVDVGYILGSGGES